MQNIFIEFLPPWVETGLQPAFYDKESGTVLQQTARMYAKVHELIQAFNDLSAETKAVVEEYIDKFIELHDYVQDYFDNLDVQEEINNKLDEMAGDGTLQELINNYLQTNVAWVFDTVANMKNSTKLVNGSYARTLGFHSIDDGGGATYYIDNNGTANESTIIAIGSTLKAHLVILGDIKPELFGAYGDGTHDDTSAFDAMLSYVSGKTVNQNNESTAPKMLLTKDYNLSTVNVPNMPVVYLIGEKARVRGGKFVFGASCGWKVRIEGITFETCANPIDFVYRNLEYGRYEVVNCIFNACTGVCISLKRRSCQTLIERCTFRGCEKTLYVEDNDMCKFINNWVECTTAWGDNHYDIEQYAPNEGSIIIENNMFIPGYSQSANNPCWIKVGRNALITGNRFSGENATIHPVIIDYDKYASFNINSTLHPIVDIRDNPIIAGSTAILIEHACGAINLTSNGGWTGGLPVLKCASADAETYFTGLDYKWLTINIHDNGGRTFVYRDDYGISLPSAYKPSVATELQRFIKNGIMYQDNYGYELKASVTSYVLSIEYCTTDLKRVNAILINGTVNKNPGGTDYYEPFIALLTLERYFDSSELRYRAHTHIITKNNQSITLETLINGQSYITALPAGENVKFTVQGTGTVRPTFKSVEMLHFKPLTNSVSN